MITIFQGFANVALIELMIPQSGASTMSGVMRKSGPGIHHVAFEVENLTEIRGKSLLAPGVVVSGNFPTRVESFGGEISALFVRHSGFTFKNVGVNP